MVVLQRWGVTWEGGRLGQMTQQATMAEEQEVNMPPHLWAALWLARCPSRERVVIQEI
jgi:hypothetical protein